MARGKKDWDSENFSKFGGSNLRGARTLLWLLIVMGILFWIWAPVRDGQQIEYSVFRQQLQEGNVESVTVQGDRIEGRLEEAVSIQVNDRTETVEQFVTYVPSFGDDQLMPLLEREDVAIQTLPEREWTWLWLLFIIAFPFLLLIGLGYLQYKRMGGKEGMGGGMGPFSMTKSRAKKYEKGQQRTTFDDVAGAEGAKEELQEIVAFFKDPGRIERLGGDVPTGVLLVGPSGTGKTLLARAVAGEADVAFFRITGSDFMEMFVGVGASRVRNMFDEAKKAAPSIIFIDELDSIGRRRGAGLGGGHDEREQTLNQLLSEMDGFEPHENVIVMAATNRPDILDPALMRPGRFDRRVLVPMPTLRDRIAILRIHARKKPLADDVDLETIARGTPGFSGADLENLLKEAALLAAREKKDEIFREDIENARDKILMGLERRGMAMTDQERRMIAFHESGHAITAALLPNADPIHKVSTIPRDRSLGVTQQLPEKDKYIYRREYMLDRLAVMMGGRAAEELVFSTSTSGAGNDLQEATRLSRMMVLQWGMSKKFRNMALGGEEEEVFLGQELAGRRGYSEATAREVDEEVRSILQEAYEKSREILESRRRELDEMAGLLFEEEEISGEKVLEILGKSG